MSQYSPTLSRRSILAIATALGGSALGLRTALGAQSAHEIVPATPATSPAESSTSILSRALDPGTGIGQDASIIATIADVDASSDALGLVRPAADADEQEILRWVFSMDGVGWPDDVAYYRTDAWTLSSGFSITDISQTAMIGEPPDMVTMYAGRFDRETAIATWAAADYTEIEDDGDIAIYSLAEDGSFSPDNEIQRSFLARRNNVAIFGSDLIIFAPRLDLLRTAIASATGEAAVLSEAPGVAALLANTPVLSGGAIVPGMPFQLTDPTVFLGSSDEVATAIASAIADSRTVPPILLMLIGVTPGGPIPAMNPSTGATPDPGPVAATMELSLLFLSRGEAEDAIASIDKNLQDGFSLMTNQPLTERFASWELSVAENDPVARVSIALKETFPSIWRKMLYARDLPFLA